MPSVDFLSIYVDRPGSGLYSEDMNATTNTHAPMTQREMIDAFAALGIDARGTRSDSCEEYEDGSYGPIITTWGVRATIEDARGGNTVVRCLTVGEPASIPAIAREMKAEVKARAKATRARARVWKSIDQS